MRQAIKLVVTASAAEYRRVVRGPRPGARGSAGSGRGRVRFGPGGRCRRPGGCHLSLRKSAIHQMAGAVPHADPVRAGV